MYFMANTTLMKNTKVSEKIKTYLKESEMKIKIKKLIREEILSKLNEDTNSTFNFKGKKYHVKFDVNCNETKKGVKIQLLPTDGGQEILNPQVKQTVSSEMQVALNQKLAGIGLTVDFDTDVPYKDVIGFTLKLETISQIVIKALQNPALPPQPSQK